MDLLVELSSSKQTTTITYQVLWFGSDLFVYALRNVYAVNVNRNNSRPVSLRFKVHGETNYRHTYVCLYEVTH